MEKEVLIIDCETAANTPDCVIEIAVMDTKRADASSYPMRPRFPILPAGTAVHGITNDEASTFPDTVDAIYAMLKDYPSISTGCILVGWNVNFDRDRINEEAMSIGVDGIFDNAEFFDLMQLAQRKFPKNVVGNYKLDTIYYHVFGDKPHMIEAFKQGRASHDAASDVRFTFDLYNALVTDIVADMDYINTPVMLEVMPWGKYQGHNIKSLITTNSDYLRWLCSQSFLVTEDRNKDLLHTLTELGMYKGGK